MLSYKQKVLAFIVFWFVGSIAPRVTNGQNLQNFVLQIENETFTDQAFFLFAEDGLIGSDLYDGFKLLSLASEYAEVYSQDTTGNNLSINTLPNNLQEILELPVFIRSTFADTFKVSVTKFENIQPNWDISLVDLSTGDTLSLGNTTSVEVIHDGTFQSGILTVKHFMLIINPGIITQQISIAGTPGKDGWRFLGSPFSNISYAQLLDSVWTQGAINSDDLSDPANTFTWNESNQTFEAVTDFNTTPGTGSGFITFMYEDDVPSNSGIDGGWPKSSHTSGIAGFGDTDFSVTYTSGVDTSLNGFNLVTNPYPFSIDWNALSGWTKNNVQDAIWIWDPNVNSGNGGYLEHISGVGDAINVIAPHQAFWVRANKANPVLSVDESVKSSGGILLKEHNIIPVLTLKLRSKEFGFEDTHYLSFREGGATSLDNYDMTKLSPVSRSYMHLYSFFDGEKLAVNNLPHDFTRLEIPIQLDHSLSGEFTFLLEDSHFFPGDIDIRLLDEKYERLIELNVLSDYTFHSDSGMYDFTLILEKAVPISNDTETDIPEHTQLFQNYPNPFNPSTTIEFEIPQTTLVTLEVFDTMGRRVATLLNGEAKTQGFHQVIFDASGLSSGIYTYRLQAGNKILTRKLTLMK